MMKAITLWEPWASAIAVGLKEFETRSWSTSYRGQIAIHAAKRWLAPDRRQYPEWRGEFPELPEEPNLGCVVALARVHRVFRTEDIRGSLSNTELRFGDYATGRFAWSLTEIEPFDYPIPAKGAQGIWNWRPHLERCA